MPIEKKYEMLADRFNKLKLEFEGTSNVKEENEKDTSNTEVAYNPNVAIGKTNYTFVFSAFNNYL